MKINTLGFTFGILAAASIGAMQARDDGSHSLSPLKPWFDSLRSGKADTSPRGFAATREPLHAGLSASRTELAFEHDNGYNCRLTQGMLKQES
ncbi:MAG: hypothetical protein JWR80_5763 [Bradyrhizobium sp.]|nr:hypothetical protein [Bradyrhizobium sp.]